MADMDSARDAERDLGDAVAGSAFSATFVDGHDIQRGYDFVVEIDDPVAYAARVLLEDM